MNKHRMFFVFFFCCAIGVHAQSGYLSRMFKYVGPEKNYQPPAPPVEIQSQQTIPSLPLMPKDQYQKILTSSFSMLGIPYVYGGMSKSGVDCSGFVGMVYQDACNMNLPRSAHDIYLKSQKVATTSSLEPGDLVFFSASGRRISHVGIYLGDEQFIHAASDGPKTGVIVSKLAERYWKRTFVGGGKVL